MGTNYFLQPAPPKCDGCGRPYEDQAPDRIHIGKSSMGWVWTWRGYPPGEARDDAPALDNSLAWYEFLAAETAIGGEIYDEYQRTHTLLNFISLVVSKRGNKRHDGQDKYLLPLLDDVVFGEFS
ncbi:hypothetical protein ACFORO_12415 [Amycolatopsis halotolerans]|uniref:Uncharacterized protein n=2 Tax=Amycolatopsis halotolerans TaxID=330083 RepID=A0ABV7QCV3_9PSEU